MAPIKVALAGGTGLLGKPILRALLSASHSVLLLTRPGSKTNYPTSDLLTVAEAPYGDVPALTQLLKSANITVVISTINPIGFSAQTALIDAAYASGTVTRFIPSEFGCDTAHPSNAVLPVYAGKVAAATKLKDLSSQNPDFTYTLVFNNLFFDSGLRGGFFVKPSTHTANIYDGGNVSVSTTRLRTVAKTIVGILSHLSETANQNVFIHDILISQNQLINLVKEIDGQEWNLTPIDTETLKRESYEELKKDQPDFGKAMVGFLPCAIYQDGLGDFSDKVWNRLLGIGEMGEAEVREMVKGIVDGSWEY